MQRRFAQEIKTYQCCDNISTEFSYYFRVVEFFFFETNEILVRREIPTYSMGSWNFQRDDFLASFHASACEKMLVPANWRSIVSNWPHTVFQKDMSGVTNIL